MSGWISVKDRLPSIISEDFDDYSEDVLVMTPDGIMIGHCEPYRDGEYAWFSNHDSVTVTHWMPLPEPPEVSGGA